jgi:glycosyltransferase involved in cell wall biosynthesis
VNDAAEMRAGPVPRFSVIITFHNQRQFIAEALDSALAQQNAAFEIIVVDDASSDGTPEVLKQYGEAVRLACLEQNVGACAARNHGAGMARGEYLVFLDGDDAFLPWALDVYNRIVDAKQPAFILATMRWFEGAIPQAGERPQALSVVEYSDYLKRDRGFGHSASAFVIARKAFEEAKGWLVGFFPLEDVELAMRLGTAGKTVQILSPQTILHRAHASNTIHNVLSFMAPTEQLLSREKRGYYPGGAHRQFERQAVIGGVAAHWIKRARKAGLNAQAVKLFAQSWPTLLAGALRRGRQAVAGKQLPETIAM